MRLEYVRSFISVVNHKSFSVAAKKMFLSQPAISTHIKQLEKELGVQLLVRSTKDVVLSEAGLIFYPYAVRLLETETEAISQLKNKGAKIEGNVVISASSVPGNYVIPGFLAYMRERLPDVSFRIAEGDSEKVIYEILHFDAGLGVGSIYCSNERCICEPLFEDEIVLITPNKEPYSRMKGEFPLEQLRRECFVVRESGSGTRKMSESMEQELKIDMNAVKIAVQFESTEMVKRGVEAGNGVAFVSRLAVRDAIEQGRLLAFSFPEVLSRRQIYLLYHKERMLTSAERATIKCIREYCAQNHF